jgi:hypothetical protein
MATSHTRQEYRIMSNGNVRRFIVRDLGNGPFDVGDRLIAETVSEFKKAYPNEQIANMPEEAAAAAILDGMTDAQLKEMGVSRIKKRTRKRTPKPKSPAKEAEQKAADGENPAPKEDGDIF